MNQAAELVGYVSLLSLCINPNIQSDIPSIKPDFQMWNPQVILFIDKARYPDVESAGHSLPYYSDWDHTPCSLGRLANWTRAAHECEWFPGDFVGTPFRSSSRVHGPRGKNRIWSAKAFKSEQSQTAQSQWLQSQTAQSQCCQRAAKALAVLGQRLAKVARSILMGDKSWEDGSEWL